MAQSVGVRDSCSGTGICAVSPAPQPFDVGNEFGWNNPFADKTIRIQWRPVEYRDQDRLLLINYPDVNSCGSINLLIGKEFDMSIITAWFFFYYNFHCDKFWERYI